MSASKYRAANTHVQSGAFCYSLLTPENGSRLHSGEAILGPVIVCIFELVRSQDRSPKGGTVTGETEPLQAAPRSGNGGEPS